MRMPIRLKKVWHRAIWSALFRCTGSPASAATMPVAVVPTFEPSVSGYTRRRSSRPRAANGSSADVKAELLWNTKVMTQPSSRLRYPTSTDSGNLKSRFMKAVSLCAPGQAYTYALLCTDGIDVTLVAVVVTLRLNAFLCRLHFSLQILYVPVRTSMRQETEGEEVTRACEDVRTQRSGWNY